jgi:hypothetical protein
MRLSIMNLIRIFLLCGILPSLLAFPVRGGDYDLERIVTTQGSEYWDVLILGADEHGLMFRHRAGIAKLPFSVLSQNLRMLYETDSSPVGDLGETDPHTESAGADEGKGTVAPVPWVVTVRNRVTFPTAVIPHHPACGVPFAWSDRRFAHALASPLYREIALSRFLRSVQLSGAGPYPCR